VLESSASKLFGLYSLSAIGLSYFLSGIILFLVAPTLAPVFALVACVAIVMPVWSVSYQKFVVHAWCKNCLGVQSSIVLLFVTELLFGRIDISELQLLPLIEFAALYLIVFYACNAVYTLVQNLRKYPQSLISSYYSLMQNDDVLRSVIESGREYDTKDASTLVITNPQDKDATELFFLLSPFCGHCKDLFFKLQEYYNIGKLSKFKVIIMFGDSSFGLPVCGSVIAEYQKNGAEAALAVLDKWYKSPKIDKFRKIYDQYEKTPELLAELSRQEMWYEKHNITGTPMMIVNSHLVDHQIIGGIVR
jgi:hypothetical protein